MASVHQILVRLVDGDTRCVHLPSPSLSGGALKLRLHALTGIPPESQFVLSGSRVVHDDTLIHASDGSFPSCSLLLRLRGGKGGFGSLLRGAATKAGQKKTNNFDACRDMNGRRLRHVNAERRLEEWKAEAEDRRLEKVAEEFLRKKAKEAKKKDGGEIDKYVKSCKEVSERCKEAIDDAVRSSFALYEKGKRKALSTAGTAASKRSKIWLGKNLVDESDSESEDDGDTEDEKSMVVDDGNQKDEVGCSSTTTSGSHSEGDSSGGGHAVRREEENLCSDENRTSEGQVSGSSDSHIDSVDSAEMKGKATADIFSKGFTCETERSTNDSLVQTCEIPTSEVLLEEEVKAHLPSMCISENLVASQKAEINDDSSGMLNETMFPTTALGISPEVTPVTVSEHSTLENIIEVEKITHQTPVSNSEEVLKLEKFDSASELEVLGLERLKVELQANGLKCGGTLQERATRLFLLKTTPFDKLPKKVLAKSSGGKRG